MHQPTCRARAAAPIDRRRQGARLTLLAFLPLAALALWSGVPARAADVAAPPAGAQASAPGSTPAAAKARFDREVAVCNSGRSNQSQANCLREANAAYAEARRGALGAGSMLGAANALKRCAPYVGQAHADCVARIENPSTTSGSVSGGGVLRTLVTVEPAASAAAPGGMPAK